jgi:hypothetical protein
MTEIPFKEILSAIAVILTFTAFIPYIREIIKGTTKPHVFSWIIWGTTTFVVFLAQLEGKGGVGAWPLGVSGTITIFIAFLAYAKRGNSTITKTDWFFLVSALSSLPLWYLTSDPLWAVVILTTIDILGFGPTVRKAYSFPHSESLLFFGLFAARDFLVLLALEHYSVTTVLFPAATAMACFLLVTLIIHRRRALNRAISPID